MSRIERQIEVERSNLLKYFLEKHWDKTMDFQYFVSLEAMGSNPFRNHAHDGTELCRLYNKLEKLMARFGEMDRVFEHPPEPSPVWRTVTEIHNEPFIIDWQ